MDLSKLTRKGRGIKDTHVFKRNSSITLNPSTPFKSYVSGYVVKARLAWMREMRGERGMPKKNWKTLQSTKWIGIFTRTLTSCLMLTWEWCRTCRWGRRWRGWSTRTGWRWSSCKSPRTFATVPSLSETVIPHCDPATCKHTHWWQLHTVDIGRCSSRRGVKSYPWGEGVDMRS